MRQFLIAVVKFFGSLMVSLYHRVFSVETVVTMNQDPRGFNVYEYEGSPTADPEMYRVAFRHTCNGVVNIDSVSRMKKVDWIKIRDRLMDAKDALPRDASLPMQH